MTHLWRCSCGGPHFLTLDTLGDDRFLMVEAITSGNSWRERIRGAVRVLRGQPHYWCEVSLNEEVADELRKACERFLIARGKENGLMVAFSSFIRRRETSPPVSQVTAATDREACGDQFDSGDRGAKR